MKKIKIYDLENGEIEVVYGNTFAHSYDKDTQSDQLADDLQAYFDDDNTTGWDGNDYENEEFDCKAFIKGLDEDEDGRAAYRPTIYIKGINKTTVDVQFWLLGEMSQHKYKKSQAKSIVNAIIYFCNGEDSSKKCVEKIEFCEYKSNECECGWSGTDTLSYIPDFNMEDIPEDEDEFIGNCDDEFLYNLSKGYQHDDSIDKDTIYTIQYFAVDDKAEEYPIKTLQFRASAIPVQD